MPVNFRVTGKPLGMLADPVDPVTGELLSIERGFDPTDAAVITALRTVRGSGSAVEDVGQQFEQAKIITPKLEPFLREEVRLALAPLTSTNQITLEQVTIEMVDNEVGVLIVYRNIAAGVDRQAFLPLGALLGRAAT